jgi:hypothetical protein
VNDSPVVRQTEDLATVDPGHAASPGDEQEAERPHAAEQVGVGALPRARLGLRKGVELEAPSHVVRQDAELLPLLAV